MRAREYVRDNNNKSNNVYSHKITLLYFTLVVIELYPYHPVHLKSVPTVCLRFLLNIREAYSGSTHHLAHPKSVSMSQIPIQQKRGIFRQYTPSRTPKIGAYALDSYSIEETRHIQVAHTISYTLNRCLCLRFLFNRREEAYSAVAACTNRDYLLLLMLQYW